MAKTMKKQKKTIQSRKLEFGCRYQTSPIGELIELQARVFVDKSIDQLVYDEIEDLLLSEIQKVCPIKYYPAAQISDIFVVEDDKRYPVVEDSDENKKNIKKLANSAGKVLILPRGIYVATDESLLYLALIEEGIVSEKYPYNYDVMHRVLRHISEYHAKIVNLGK